MFLQEEIRIIKFEVKSDTKLDNNLRKEIIPEDQDLLIFHVKEQPLQLAHEERIAEGNFVQKLVQMIVAPLSITNCNMFRYGQFN